MELKDVRNAQKFYESWEWATLRYRVLQDRGRYCECCGIHADDPGCVITVDHILPRSTYPEYALDINNLQVLCFTCNRGKGHFDATDFRVAANDDFYDSMQPYQLKLIF